MMKSEYECLKKIVEHMKKFRSKKFKLSEITNYHYKDYFQVNFEFRKT